MTDLVPIRRALISVSDKTGLTEFAAGLARHGAELISTGGTATALRGAGLQVKDVADLTGFPQMMDGRVKTLHPAVHGGLLAVRDNPEHMAALDTHRIAPIDLVVVNLYPFEDALARGADPAEMIEQIDIGGPAMLRSAAKNFRHVSVITDVADYDDFLASLDAHGGAVPLDLRSALAATAFARTAAYDAAVSGWMADRQSETPRRRSFAGNLLFDLRYGENPHQNAAFYADGTGQGLSGATQLQGKALSYNNINDTDAALGLIAEFDPGDGPACAIIKHANPCGVALGDGLDDAFSRAFACDRTSAFGGIIALNHPLDATTARLITEIFTEVVIAPGACDEARKIFAAKPNLRLLTVPHLPDPRERRLSLRQVLGGLLVQDADTDVPQTFQVVTKRRPTDAEMQDMRFAWVVAKHVKSNAIVYAKDRATVGIGAGQMSRVDSSRIAARKAQDMAEAMQLGHSTADGSVVASDAFFPFSDGLIAAAQAGARAVIQPGGSRRDAEVIDAANEMDLAMVFTGMRHFRH